jgi:eukaryotic-like serine/threonine-protein kinase
VALGGPKQPRSADADPATSVEVEELRVSELIPISASELESGAGSRAQPARSERDEPFAASEPSRIARRTRHEFIDLPRGSLVGEYEIERKIGEGGMGSVYAAVHSILGKRVAIKIIAAEVSKDEGAIARFRREARVVAQLASPHIVDVSGFGELADGRAYFVMEFLVGELLRDRLARGRVPLDEALELLDQIIRGLEAAHEAGIVHRDLKPENIFIVRGRATKPVVKLLDFGIVKLSKQDKDVAKTQAGVLIGTPLYAAPEQIRAAAEVDHRADIYALGGVAFEMILGRVPFVRSTVVELIAAHLECPPPQPRTLWPEIPAVLDAVLAAMLVKDPMKRPTLGHVQEAIEKLRSAASANVTPTIGLFEVGGSVAPTRASSPPTPPAATPAPTSLVSDREEPVPASSSHVQTTFGLAAGTRIIPVPPPASHPARTSTRARVGVVTAALAAIFVVVAIASRRDESQEDTKVASSPVAATDASVIVSAIEVADAAAQERVASDSAPGAVTVALPAQHPSAAVSAPSLPTTPRSPAVPNASQHVTNASTPVDGELAISAKPPCDVAIDGKPTGRRTPVTDLSLAGGIHSVTLTNAQFGISETAYVQVMPGKQARVVKDYSARLPRVDPNGTINPFAGSGR